jgi:hypothetical protein
MWEPVVEMWELEHLRLGVRREIAAGLLLTPDI